MNGTSGPPGKAPRSHGRRTFEAERGGAATEDQAGERDELGGDGLVQREAVRGAVGEAVEAAEAIGAVVGQLGGGSLGPAVVEEAVEQVIELGLDRAELGRDGAPGGLAPRTVRVVLAALDVGQRGVDAVPVEAHASPQLAVGGAQVLLGGLERDEGGAVEVGLVAQHREGAGVARREASRRRVLDEPPRETVAQRFAGRAEDVDVDEPGARGLGVVGAAAGGDLSPRLGLGEVALELGPVAQPLLEGPGIVGRQRSRAELAVAGLQIGEPIEAHARGQVAPRRRRERAEHVRQSSTGARGRRGGASPMRVQAQGERDVAGMRA
ncbi:hypothetical protein [Nannocystis pusilla]|uniref:hypothetical protein n=1 Tax=Nannocystis pusilla TaxID=889268 RepID=UPI003DA42C5C